MTGTTRASTILLLAALPQLMYNMNVLYSQPEHVNADIPDLFVWLGQ